MRREKHLQLSASLAFLLIAAMAALPFWVNRAVGSVLGQLQHEVAGQERLVDVLAGLREAALAQRGFVITGDAAFLESYADAWQKLPPLLRAGRDKARTEAERATARRVEQLAGRELADLGDTIELRRNRGRAAAAASVVAPRANATMAELRRIVDAETARSQAQRDRLRAELLHRADRATALATAAGLVNLGVLASLLLVLMRRLRERQESVRRLGEHAGELTAAVEQAGRRNDELALIAEMLRAIDGLPSDAAAGPAIARCFGRLLPGRAGTVYLRREDDDMLVRLVQWGAASNQPLEIRPDACRALRPGGAVAASGRTDLACDHLHDAHDAHDAHGAHGGTRLCIPLVTHDALIGLVYLEDLPADPRRRGDVQLLALQAAEQLALALANARRRAAPTALVVLDIDHFKLVNDTYGHGIGDEVLRSIAQQIRGAVREGDIACRYGGEELVILIPECAAAVATERAELLRAAIEAAIPDTGGDGPRRVTASIGVAEYPTHGVDAMSLFRAADKALYQAKRQGRNQVVAAEEPA